MTIISCNRRSTLEVSIINSDSYLPIENAYLTLNGKTKRTKNNGKVSFDNVYKNKEYLIKVTHPEFSTAQRFVKVSNFDTQRTVSIPLNEREKITRFNSSEKAEVSFAQKRGKVSIPATKWEIIGNNGNENKPYSGFINLSITYFDPNNSNDMSASPLPLIALEDKQRIPLISFGMIEINATDMSGNQLDIIGTEPITIELPVVNERLESTGWYIASNDGMWQLMGNLNYNPESNTLIGSVNTISSAWNADDPCNSNLECVQVQVLNQDGTPANTGFHYRGLSYQTSWEFTSTDVNGIAFLNVCPGQVFQLFSFAACCAGQPVTDPSYDFCCNQGGISVIATIDLSTVTMTPPCTDLGIIQL